MSQPPALTGDVQAPYVFISIANKLPLVKCLAYKAINGQKCIVMGCKIYADELHKVQDEVGLTMKVDSVQRVIDNVHRNYITGQCRTSRQDVVYLLAQIRDVLYPRYCYEYRAYNISITDWRCMIPDLCAKCHVSEKSDAVISELEIFAPDCDPNAIEKLCASLPDALCPRIMDDEV